IAFLYQRSLIMRVRPGPPAPTGIGAIGSRAFGRWIETRRHEMMRSEPNRRRDVPVREDFAATRDRWAHLTFYEKFEHIIVLILTGLIAIVIVFAVWNLVLKIALSIVVS